MKILLSSYHNPNFITITEYIEFAIEELKHELIRFDDRQHIVPGRLRDKIKWLADFDQKCLNNNLVSIVDKTNPEIAIIAGGHRIKKAVIDRGCVIPNETTIGVNLEEDKKKYYVSPGGVVLVIPEMLGQQLHHVR